MRSSCSELHRPHILCESLFSSSNVEGHLSLLEKFLLSLLELLTGEFVNREAVDYLPLSIFAYDREGVDYAWSDTVGVSFTVDTHAGILTWLGADPPIVHVIASSVGC